MLGELLYPEHLKAHLATILEWKNLIIHNVYGAEPYKLEDMLAWCEEFGGKLRPFLCDVPKYLYAAEKAGKNIMFEAQLGEGRAQRLQQHAGGRHLRVADHRHEAQLGRREQAAQAVGLVLGHVAAHVSGRPSTVPPPAVRRQRSG